MTTELASDRVLVSPKVRAPLTDDLRYDLQSLLLKHDQIKALDSALRDSCAADGWQKAVEERVMDMLRNGDVKNMRQLERRVINEALGKDGQHDGKDQRNGANITQNRQGNEKSLKVPESAVKAGTKVVRDVLEKSVDVKVEQIEDKEWRDWR